MIKKLQRSLPMAAVLLLMTIVSAFAQKQVVTGKVSDASGQGMPGVNILLKGTATGTTTDADGRFSIEANSSDILVVSFIGYSSQEIQVGNQTSIDVQLVEDLKTLEEVVVVGYGEMRRSDITAAQTSIGSKELTATVNTTLEQALQGRAPGVLVTQNTGAPGGGFSVMIRGMNTLTSNNEPLYVIDGVQVQGTQSPNGLNPLASLNPNDVENVQTLEGPNATAIYGSRGTNGVVLVTTKRGKAGEFKINYDYSYNLQDAPAKMLDVMNLRQYAQMENEYKGLVGGDVREDFLDPSILGNGTDWQKELFRRAAWQTHQIGMSGGSDKVRFYLSTERTNQEGVALGSSFKRTSIRLNLDGNPRPWLQVNLNLNPTQTDDRIASTQSNLIVNAIQLAPHIPVRNIDGTYGGGNISNSSAEQFAPPNPVGLAEITTNEWTRRRLQGGLNIGLTFLKNFEFRVTGNTDMRFENSTYFLPTYQFGYQQNVIAVLNNNHNLNTAWTLAQTLQFRKSFGKHHLDVMATHEANESKWKNLYAQRRGFFTNDILDIGAGNEANDDTGGGRGSWAMESYLGRLNYNYDDRYILTAAFRADGSVNFGPAKKWGYFPSVSGAWRISEENFMDAIEAISDLRIRLETGLTGNQGPAGAIYGTLSTGPSEWGTSFMPNVYNNPNYAWEDTNTNNLGLTVGLFANRVKLEGDLYVKKSSNLIMRSALPWYMGTEGSGSIGPPTVNIGSLENRGWSLVLRTMNIDKGPLRWESDFNISAFKTEVTSLTTSSAQIDNISWWMSNWTQRTVVGEAPWMYVGYVQEGIFQSLDELNNSALPVDNNGNEFVPAENTVWVGDVKYKDVNGDGKITGADQTFIGNPFPKLFGGFNNRFTYKGLELNVLITFTYGNDVYNYLRFENSNPNNINLGRNMFVTAFDYAKVAEDELGNPYLLNPDTEVARMSASNRNNNFDRLTSKYVEDGSYIRVKNISLRYQVPQNWLDKTKVIKAAYLRASVQNAFTITGYSGYDPEIGSYVGPNASGVLNTAVGVDYGRYPSTPTYSFGIGVEF